MNIIDYTKLNKEIERLDNVVLEQASQELEEYPMVASVVSKLSTPVTVVDLEVLREELNHLLVELHELCNGYINDYTPLCLYYDDEKRPWFLTSGLEGLGSWKKRLKKMKDQLSFDPKAVEIIQNKLNELNEIVKLDDK